MIMNYFNLLDNELIIYILGFIHKNYSFIIHSTDRLFSELTNNHIILMPMDISRNSPELIIPYINYACIENNHLLMKMYICGGYLDKCNEIYYDDFLFSHDIIYEAIISGNLDIVKWIDKKVRLENTEYLYPAVRYGQIGILKFLINKGLFPDERTMWNAIDIDNYNIIMYLLEIDCPISFFELNHLARRGNLKSIEMFYNNGYIFDTTDMEVACGEGNKDVVKLFESYGISLDIDCMDTAIRANNKYIIERCISSGIVPNKQILYNTIYYCDRENMDIVFDNYKIVPYCYEAAISKNSPELCNYIFNRGLSIPENLSSYGILMGKIEIWEWLYKKRCKYNSVCYKSILMCGYDDALKYLDGIGCVPTIEALCIAIRYSNTEILLYFIGICKRHNIIIRRSDVEAEVKNRSDPVVTYMIYDYIKV